MGFAETYFRRFRVSPELISQHNTFNAAIIVVIPVCNEPELLDTLRCLTHQEEHNIDTLILTVINHSEDAPESVKQQNHDSLLAVNDFAACNNTHSLCFLPLCLFDIPRKKAGVGIARKTGMDEALRIFDRHDRTDGIIVSLDADCLVDNRYLNSISAFFKEHTQHQAASLYFEHPVSGTEFTPDIYEAIARYELHLRYFRLGLEYAGYPYPIHTVGSCFALRATAYAAAGGMNTRQAGEDFYFLHKLTAFTNIACVSGTCVVPSPRASQRVPFGTGPAVGKAAADGFLNTYNFELFSILRNFFEGFGEYYQCMPEQIIPSIYRISPQLGVFCDKNRFLEQLLECRNHTATPTAFTKRLFRQFNAFGIIKFLNEASDSLNPRISVETAATRLLSTMGYREIDEDLFELLQVFRKIDSQQCI